MAIQEFGCKYHRGANVYHPLNDRESENPGFIMIEKRVHLQ